MDKNLRSQIMDLTKKLLSIHYTATDASGMDDIVAIVKKELANYPLEEFEQNGYKSLLIRNVDEPVRKFKVLLNAHLDVMPAKEEAFQPVEKNGRLYGRGTYDMKAATAIMILVFKYLAKHLPYPVGLQIVTDEEIMGKDCTKYQIEQGIRSDFIITGECGSNFNIISHVKGILWVKLHTNGVKAHGAHPWKGDNALWKLHQALYKLQQLFPIPEKEDWVSTMNLAKIETTNERFNHVPDGATAYVDIRFVAEEEKGLLERIKQTIGPDVEIEIMTHESPEYIDPENPFVLSLAKAIKETTGEPAKLATAHASSDLRHFNTVGCHGVEFGLKGHGQHSDDEWVDIKNMEEYFSVLETFLIDAIKI